MARLPRIVIPGIPHHVTQRGNRRQPTFFEEDDYGAYIELLRQRCLYYGVEILAYCLMPNHVHLIAIPKTQDSLRLSIGETHEFYTKQINFRMGWRGHLWQGRFFSSPMDDDYLLKCVRYIELNPVRAQLSSTAEEYRWSSARAHLTGEDDGLVKASSFRKRFADWNGYLQKDTDPGELELLRKHSRTGRPLGNQDFIHRLEEMTGLKLTRKKPGPKPKVHSE